MRQFSIVFVSILLLSSVPACAGPTATTMPIPLTASTPTRERVTSVLPTLTPSQATPQPTATTSANLKKDTIDLVAPLSADDAETVIQALQNLGGVQDVQTSGQQLLVIYDSNQITLADIFTVIKSFGIAVKN